MFKIVPNPTFEGVVQITIPGESTPATLRVTWRHMGRRALAVWLKKTKPAVQPAAQPVDQPAEPATVQTDAEWLAEAMANWAGPVDESGAAVPLSLPALAALLDSAPASGSELLAAYLREMTESRAKN